MKDARNNNSNLLFNQMFSKMPENLLSKLNDINFGIAGCGGLGSNIALTLARCGVKKIILVDFDKIEISNLNRQQYFFNDIGKFKAPTLKNIIKKINPFVEVKAIIGKINNNNIFKLFKKCNIVFEAFDSVEAKSLIIKSFGNPLFSDKLLIGAAGVSGFGLSNKIHIEKLAHNIYIIGDFKTSPEMGLVAPKVILSAMYQVNLAFDLIMNNVISL